MHQVISKIMAIRMKEILLLFFLFSFIIDMFVWRQFFHTSISRYLAQSAASTNAPSPLSILRKKTGYSLSHCRSALQQFNENLEQVKCLK